MYGTITSRNAISPIGMLQAHTFAVGAILLDYYQFLSIVLVTGGRGSTCTGTDDCLRYACDGPHTG
jgi:hypothetical protein